MQNNLAGIEVSSGNPSEPIEAINNTLDYNDVSDNSYGINIWGASSTTIANNTVNNNAGESGKQG